ncbi:hypothetical protein F5X68DRAFT_265019 [Plectosphaerella plurivora]|uniref:Uncharacterized protein n=1 Tax=Plectosphaerella plurivora TaxID=936078 RepID=A0A9P8V340_9PEZI|nr:hypothetical protein F5X68DRAFT_265019 [Plectosphaerella plurivora]
MADPVHQLINTKCSFGCEPVVTDWDHFHVGPQCGLCGDLFKLGEEIVCFAAPHASVSFAYGNKYTTFGRMPAPNNPSNLQTNPVFCHECSESPAPRTVHPFCLELYLSLSKSSPTRVCRLWHILESRFIYDRAPSLQLPPQRDLERIAEVAGRFEGTQGLVKLPQELRDIIAAFLCHDSSLVARLSAIVDVVRQADQHQDAQYETVKLETIQRWRRGKAPTFLEEVNLRNGRLTTHSLVCVDWQGILSIDLEERNIEDDHSKDNTSSASTKITTRNATSTFNRLLHDWRDDDVEWIYVPISSRVRAFGVRKYEGKVIGYTIDMGHKDLVYVGGNTSSQDAEDITYNTPPGSGLVLSPASRAWYYGATHPSRRGERQGAEILSVYGAASQWDPDDERLPTLWEVINPVEVEEFCFSQVYLTRQITGIYIYFDEATGLCRGLIFENRDGSKMAMGSCRVGVDDPVFCPGLDSIKFALFREESLHPDSPGGTSWAQQNFLERGESKSCTVVCPIQGHKSFENHHSPIREHLWQFFEPGDTLLMWFSQHNMALQRVPEDELLNPF